MKNYKFEDMTRGWLMGNFEPSLIKTDKFEIAYQYHQKDEQHDIHYHKKGTEYNLITQGKLIWNGKEFGKGDIVVIEPYEVSEIAFLTDVEIVVIKVPGAADDKYVIK